MPPVVLVHTYHEPTPELRRISLEVIAATYRLLGSSKIRRLGVMPSKPDVVTVWAANPISEGIGCVVELDLVATPPVLHFMMSPVRMAGHVLSTGYRAVAAVPPPKAPPRGINPKAPAEAGALTIAIVTPS